MNVLRRISYRTATRFSTLLTLLSGLAAMSVALTSGDGATVILFALFAVVFAFLTVATIIGELQERVEDLRRQISGLAAEVFER